MGRHRYRPAQKSAGLCSGTRRPELRSIIRCRQRYLSLSRQRRRFRWDAHSDNHHNCRVLLPAILRDAPQSTQARRPQKAAAASCRSATIGTHAAIATEKTVIVMCGGSCNIGRISCRGAANAGSKPARPNRHKITQFVDGERACAWPPLPRSPLPASAAPLQKAAAFPMAITTSCQAVNGLAHGPRCPDHPSRPARRPYRRRPHSRWRLRHLVKQPLYNAANIAVMGVAVVRAVYRGAGAGCSRYGLVEGIVDERGGLLQFAGRGAMGEQQGAGALLYRMQVGQVLIDKLRARRLAVRAEHMQRLQCFKTLQRCDHHREGIRISQARQGPLNGIESEEQAQLRNPDCTVIGAMPWRVKDFEGKIAAVDVECRCKGQRWRSQNDVLEERVALFEILQFGTRLVG